MPEHLNFWLGHQGYEYLVLGRVWQLVKFLGLAFWLLLMLRGMLPAFKKDGDKNLPALLAASTIAIGLFYGTGLFRSEEHTSELQSLMRISYAVFCLKKKKKQKHISN